jgi:hypothetical protein
VSSLVSLKLDNLAEVFVFNDSTIAREFLLEVLEQLLRVELVRYALNCGQGLSTVSLLDANVHVFRSLGGLLERILGRELIGISEGVCKS